MPPPSLGPRSIPRGASAPNLLSAAAQQNRSTSEQTQPDAALTPSGGATIVQPIELQPQQQQLPSSIATAASATPASTSHQSQSQSSPYHGDGGDDALRPMLPSTHTSPFMGPAATVGPAATPAASEAHAPGSGIFVKRKVMKSLSSLTSDTPQPARRNSPGRTSGGTPKSILRNPVARHSTITFSADVAGLTLAQVESVAVLKKSDVEQHTLRDEVFASLHGPVTSKEQITVNIAADSDGQGLCVEGIIDHLRSVDEQNAAIRRLADFLHSPHVFGKSLAPFLTIGALYGSGERTINDAIQRILVREARINDVPIKSVAPSSARSPAGTVRSKTPNGSVVTPQWDPDYSAMESSQSYLRFEKRKKTYQSSLGVLYSTSLSIPTPHNGPWDRAQDEPLTVRPDEPTQSESTATDHQQVSPTRTSSRGYSYVPHGVVESPTKAENARVFPAPANASLAVVTPVAGANGQTVRQIYREPFTGGGFASPAPVTSQQKVSVYRTRQYVVDEPRRIRGQ